MQLQKLYLCDHFRDNVASQRFVVRLTQRNTVFVSRKRTCSQHAISIRPLTLFSLFTSAGNLHRDMPPTCYSCIVSYNDGPATGNIETLP